MPAQITTSSSNLPKDNINGAISTSGFTAASSGGKIQNVTLTELQNAINKLSTYANKVSNCGNCKAYTIKSTSCESTTCQSTGCQSTPCQSTSCQSQCYNKYSQYTDYYSNYSDGGL